MNDFTSKNENQLVSAYKDSGDQKYIGELYKRYNRLVFGSCLKYLKDNGLAEDAVNDIFVQITKKLKTHNVEYFKSWLYTVTRNHCIEILRKENRHRDKKTDSELMYTESIFHPDEVEDANLIATLAECIEALPTNQQKCIQLFYYDRVSYQDIAETLELNWNKVRSFIQNGRRNLKNCITSKQPQYS